MRPTIKDISKKTGYTAATISRALNDSSLVSDRTKEKIIAVAEEIGYVKAAESTRQGDFPTVGIIVPDITNPYFPVLIKGIQDYMSGEGYNTVLCNSNASIQDEINCFKMLSSLQVKGIIIDPISDLSYENLRKVDSDICTVFISNVPKGENLNYVTMDNYLSASIATNYLISLGHKRIAYVGGGDDTNTYRERYRGFCNTMIKHFGYLDKEFAINVYPNRENGFDATKQLMSQGEMPTAFFASNDDLALGILEYLWMHGLEVPEDISVIGIDNIEYGSLPRINLTTVEEKRYKIGKLGAQSMLDFLENKNQSPVNIVLKPNLIIRNTCGKARDL